MKKLAVIYHSAHGHTEHIASHIAQGAASVAGMAVHVLKASELAGAPDTLLQYDGVLLGSPTYLGGVSGVFKTFMDATGKMWRTQQLKGKLAGGFTVSSHVHLLHAARDDLGRQPDHPGAALWRALRRGGEPPGLMERPDGAGRAWSGGA
jgi:multimeric flavodoxin WrbA